MPWEVKLTTAEHVVAVTDAVLSKPTGCDEVFVSRFTDIPEEGVRRALHMAIELGLVCFDAGKGYQPKRPFAVYLSTSKDAQKAAILRLMLESYEPFRTFKHRLNVSGLVAQAAEEVKVIYGMPQHRDEIKDTLTSLGTYAQSLVTEGAGLFRNTEFNEQHAAFLSIAANVAEDRSLAELKVRRKLGDEVIRWISSDEVLSPLVTAYQRLELINDTRSPIVHAGNAMESFLVQLAAHHTVNLAGATGINSKAARFNTHLTPKHKSMIMYVGHIRNAADHGVDTDIGSSWNISEETAVEYVHVAISTIRSVVIGLSGQHVL